LKDRKNGSAETKVINLAADDFWKWIGSRCVGMGAKQRNEIINRILMASRKAFVTVSYTTQLFSMVDKNIRDITDLLFKPVLSPDMKYCKVYIYGVVEGRLLQPMQPQYFMTEPIFATYNSVLGDQTTIYFNDEKVHIRKFDEIENLNINNTFVPCFNPKTHKMEIKKISNFIKHKYDGDAFEIITRFGRKLKVTGDHSVFVWCPPKKWNYRNYKMMGTALKKGSLNPKPVRELRVGDWIAIPKTLPVIERDLEKIDVFELVKKYKFHYSYKKENGKIWLRVKKLSIPLEIKVTDDLLWLLGFLVAEGHISVKHCLTTLSSETILLEKAKKIIKDVFGLDYKIIPPYKNKSPSIRINHAILTVLFKELLKDLSWVIQLPLKRLKFFLYGWWQGDGYHNGNFKNNFIISTSNEKLVDLLIMILTRFGFVGTKIEFNSKFNGKYFKTYQISCTVKPINILEWDKGVEQKLNAKIIGDLVLAKIKSIKPCKVNGYVYDFSVPENENFIAGNLVCCHNTFERASNISMDEKEEELTEQYIPIEKNPAWKRYCKVFLGIDIDSDEYKKKCAEIDAGLKIGLDSK
jgi:intein/homing endonuclease